MISIKALIGHGDRIMTDSRKQTLLQSMQIAVVIVLALWQRTQFFEYSTFETQDGMFLIPTLDLIVKKEIPLMGSLLGLSSAFHGPAAYFLFSIPMLISKHPASIYFFMALVNTSAAFLLYRICREHFSHAAGIVAAAIFAFNPELVDISREVVDDTFAPFFIVLTYYLMFSILAGKRTSVSWFLFPLVICAGFQIHFQLLIPVGIFILLCGIYRIRFNTAAFFLGLIPGIALQIPVMNFNQMSVYSNTLKTLQYLWEHIEGKPEDALVATSGVARLELFQNLPYEFLLFIPAVSLIAFIIWNTRGKPDNRKYILLLLLAITPLLVISGYEKQNFRRYFVSYIPILAAVGIMISCCFKGSNIRIIKQNRRLLFSFIGIASISVILWFSIVNIRINHVRYEKRTITDQNDYEWIDSWRYRLDFHDVLFNEFHIDEEAFLNRVHGTQFYRMIGDGGYLFRTMNGNETSPIDDAHYIIKTGKEIEPFEGSFDFIQTVILHGLTFAAYESILDYDSFRMSHVWQYGVDESVENRSWAPYSNKKLLEVNHLTGPWSSWNRVWEGTPLIVRGNFSKTDVARPVLFTVEVVFSNRCSEYDWDKDVNVATFINGEHIEPVDVKRFMYPEFGDAYIFRYMPSDIHDELETFIVEIQTGQGYDSFGLDIYDIPLKNDI